MSHAIYTIPSLEALAEDALSLAPVGAINRITCKQIESPWREKIRLHSKRGCVEAVFHLWKSGEYLEARIHRLARYVLDSLDPSFKYDLQGMLSLDANKEIRRAHNHIWSIYVDSRMERMGFENFFDRSIRRNLFIDSQRAHSWFVLSRVFDRLWEKESFSHSEIIDYARKLRDILNDEGDEPDAFEVEINRYRGDSSAKDFVAAITSPELRMMGERLLTFVISQCRGAIIEPSCYGIRFSTEGIVFAEMVTTKRDFLFVTVFDLRTDRPMSYTTGPNFDNTEKIQTAMKEVYTAICLRARANRSEEPLRVPI